MLYIFLVDTGTMMTFDMNLALESVSTLKKVVARACKISEDKQVLLISGGESLEPSAKVCNYSAGTDTSPIFLFSKSAIESVSPPLPSVDYGSDTDMKDQVEGCLNLPSTYNTVAARTQLAQQFNELAKEQRRICERLVHDQHLQQQGWAAVVANLEDISSAFKDRADVFELNFKQYLDLHSYYVELLQGFSQDLSLLSKIPVLPALLCEPDVEENQVPKSSTTLTLLQWISSKDNQSSLEQVADQCLRGLDQLGTHTLESLQGEIQTALEAVNNSSMKEVKGLEERLCGLEQLMYEARQYESEQGELAQAFLQNQARAGNLGDTSILPDLCTSHQRQLQLMLRNHQLLRDIRRRCTLAKEELSVNLHSRLRWIMYVEKTMCDVDNKLVIYHENLKRLKRHLEIVQQIHLAPKVYLTAVAEVVRRRNFSKTFLQWAGSLSEQSLDLHRKEVATRKAFSFQISNHFLQTLFPGMEDYPPPFATQTPESFDTHLPNIVSDDLEKLSQILPELSDLLKVPSQESMPRASNILTNSVFDGENTSSMGPAGYIQSFINPQHQSLVGQECINDMSHDHMQQATVNLASASSHTEDSFISTGDSDLSNKLVRSPLRKPLEESEIECKRLHLNEGARDKDAFSPIEEEKCGTESDTEEFEQVDEIPKDHTETNEEYLQLQSELYEDHTHPYHFQKSLEKSKGCSNQYSATVGDVILTRAYSDSDIQVSPMERIKSPDSLLATSQDFLTADFFIDESMPSSYTESNGTSGLLRGNQMVKSHHVVVAELQRQLEERTSTLVTMQGSLKVSRSNIMKVHTTMNTLKKLAQEVKDHLKADLEHLRALVLQERELVLHEVTVIMDKLRDTAAKIRLQVLNDKALAVDEAIEKEQAAHRSIMEQCQQQLEVEAQKLADAHQEIKVYHEQLQRHSDILEKLREEAEIKVDEVKFEMENEKEDIIRKLMLEHEVELENLKEDNKKSQDNKDEEIKELRETLLDKTAQFHMLCKEKEVAESGMNERFQQEKTQLLRTLEENYKERERIAIQWSLQNQSHLHQKEIERLKIEHEEVVNKLKESLEKEVNQEFDEKLQKLKEDVVDLSTHETLVAKLHQDFEEEKLQAISEALEVQGHEHESKLAEALKFERIRHEANIAEVTGRLKRDHQEQITVLRATLQAEKQVIFNEAVGQVTREKDAMIQELQRQEVDYRTQQDKDRAALERLLQKNYDLTSESEKVLSAALERERQERTARQQLEVRLKEAEQKTTDLRKPSEMFSSVAVLSEPVQNFQDHRFSELEMKLKAKEAELASLQQQVISLSVHPVTSPVIPADKISVLACNVGDVVLLFFDGKYENYMVFVLGPVLHFLHAECLDALGLKLVPEEPSRAWALAEVLDKDYCQAKKPHNRYKVPVGTRFYRVKAKPWDKEAALRRHHQRRSSSVGGPSGGITASQISAPSESSSSPAMSASSI